jgi:small-conductance mechanosensitive channel
LKDPIEVERATKHAWHRGVVQTDLGDYAVSYLLIGKTLDPKLQLPIQSDLRRNLMDVFNREDIEIMTPSVTAIRDANNLGQIFQRLVSEQSGDGT